MTQSAAAAEFRQRLERRDAMVGVVGLGYVAKAGVPGRGVEADDSRVECIGRGPLGAQPHVIRL